MKLIKRDEYEVHDFYYLGTRFVIDSVYQYMAVDANGHLNVFEVEPLIGSYSWRPLTAVHRRIGKVDLQGADWRDKLISLGGLVEI